MAIDEVWSSRRGKVVRADALELLQSLAPESADIVFLDPPFNLGKRYGESAPKADRVSSRDYETFLVDIVEAACQALKPGGALYLYHLPRWAMVVGAAMPKEMEFRHWIAIAQKNGFVRGKRLYPAHYALLFYTKGDPAVFNRPKITPATCPHCGEFVKDYGGYRSMVEHGVNLSDFWDDLHPVRHLKYKLRSSNELPAAIPARAIEISGVRNGLFVDPFAGTGTSIVVAKAHGMRFLAGDKELPHCQLIVRRLEELAR